MWEPCKTTNAYEIYRRKLVKTGIKNRFCVSSTFTFSFSINASPNMIDVNDEEQRTKNKILVNVALHSSFETVSCSIPLIAAYPSVIWLCCSLILKLIKIAMGKNKHQKVKNIFKVAGAKSLKPKSKAKVVKGQLKQITLKNKSKILEVDQQLLGVQEKVLQNNQKIEPAHNNPKTAPTTKTTTEEDYKEMEMKTDTTLQNLNNMQLLSS
ncbi:hypothetical protein Trydic_g19154 [Trypoxylus dichotomus]